MKLNHGAYFLSDRINYKCSVSRPSLTHDKFQPLYNYSLLMRSIDDFINQCESVKVKTNEIINVFSIMSNMINIRNC